MKKPHAAYDARRNGSFTMDSDYVGGVIWVFDAGDARAGHALGSAENGWRSILRHAKGPMAARAYHGSALVSDHGSVQTKLSPSPSASWSDVPCITCSVVQRHASRCHYHGRVQTRLPPSSVSWWGAL